MRRRALITGAAGGLGKAFAWEFASQGWDLYLTDIVEGPLEILADGVKRAHGVDVLWSTSDLSGKEGRGEVIAAIRGAGLKFGALVNVAGYDLEGAFRGRDQDDLVSLMRVNMEAGLVLTHAITEMRDGWEPLRVINTASLAAFFPMPYKATYAASKAFVLSSSLALREELRGLATVTVLCAAGMPTTPSCREAIDAQGLMGRLTTRNTSDVSRATYKAAMRGRPVVIPGWINRVLLMISRLVPKPLLALLLGRRWGAAGKRGRPAPVSVGQFSMRSSPASPSARRVS
jgi:short-subunit dehydrogenase